MAKRVRADSPAAMEKVMAGMQTAVSERVHDLFTRELECETAPIMGDAVAWLHAAPTFLCHRLPKALVRNLIDDLRRSIDELETVPIHAGPTTLQ
jgi:hypothetical protein